MTYQPKHLPPSLDYEAWLREADALPQEWNEYPAKDATWSSASSGEPLEQVVFLWDEKPHVGHDWESRSWFA